MAIPVLSTIGVAFKAAGLWVKLAALGLLLGILIGVPTYTYFHGKTVGREELLLEIADAKGKETEKQVKENVKRAEAAVVAIGKSRDTLTKEQREYEDVVKSNEAAGDCSCRATDDELREYNEIVRAANGGGVP